MSEQIRVIEEKPTRAECVKTNLRLQIGGFFETRSDKSVLQFGVTRGGGQNAIPWDTDTYYSLGPDQCTRGMKIVCRRHNGGDARGSSNVDPVFLLFSNFSLSLTKKLFQFFFLF